MTEQYDEVESRFGISAYASSHDGFTAVLKARFTDFIVHEVDIDGKIARLDSLEVLEIAASKEDGKAAASDKPGDNPKKRKFSGDQQENKTDTSDKDITCAVGSPDKRIVDWESSQNDLSKLVGDDAAIAVIAMLRHWEKSSQENSDKDIDIEKKEKFITLPAVPEKEKRRGIHMLIKSDSFRPFARADTHEGRVRIWHQRFEKEIPNFGHYADDKRTGNNTRRDGRNNNRKDRKPVKKEPWPDDRPDFLHFVLYKENIDTTTAAKDVAWRGRLNRKDGIGYAGMKDKRGVTTQWCSAYRGDRQALIAINSQGTRGTSGGGNNSTKGFGIIRVGNFSYSSDEIKLGMLAGNRFDIVLRNVDTSNAGIVDAASSPVTLEKVQNFLQIGGKAMHDIGFINYFGMQRFGIYFDTHEVGIAILKGDFEAAVDIIMRVKTNEYGSDRVAGARTRWATRFEGVDMKDETATKQAERNCVRKIEGDFGRFMNCENSIVSILSRKPRDYKKAFQSISKNMRSMFLHAYQSYLWNKVASRRIENGGSREVRVGDLVLISDLSRDEGGSGTSGLKGKSVKVLEEEDLKSGKYSILDVVLPLVGTKIRFPAGTIGEYYLELMSKDGINIEHFSKIDDIQLACGGDYRKLICKPGDVTYEIKSYYNPLQPLIQTDLMKVTGTDILASSDGSTESNEPTEPEPKEKKKLFGMVIGFTLPPSSYATIALRELMKRPTSSDYQSQLSIE